MFIRRPLGGIAVLLVLATWGCTEFEEDDSPHPEAWDTGHIEKLQVINYDLTSCQACHGGELNGTDEVDGCSSDVCHTASQGQSVLDAIYACDNCHGYLDSDPFVDVKGRTSSDLVTVGMHTSHYTAAHSLTSNVSCGSCHVVPDSVFAAGHIDETPYAEIPFGTPTAADSTFTLSWDRQSATCSDTYCHGNFRFEKAASSSKWIYTDSLIVGNNQPVTWTDSLTGENQCTTCHGYPPTGHLQSTKCGDCHTSVDETNHLSIIDTQKHINGRADYP